MIQQKNLNLGHIANRELRKKGFVWEGSHRTSATVKSFREGFEDSLRRQLSGYTYAYIVRPEVQKDKPRYRLGYHIDQYSKKEEES